MREYGKGKYTNNYSKNSGYFKYSANSPAPKPAKISPVQKDNDSGLPKPNAKKPTLLVTSRKREKDARRGGMRRGVPTDEARCMYTYTDCHNDHLQDNEETFAHDVV